MTPVLDDLDSRPGSTTSLLRTVVGLYLRRLGGWVPVARLIQLMADLEVPEPRTRTAVVRLKRKNLLVPRAVDGVVGYELHPDAPAMLAAGDRRIFQPRSMAPDDAWCLVSFSLPEALRDVRHQLRRRLDGIGCGTVSPALWICPDFLADEVEGILGDLGIRDHATLFRSERPRVAGELADAITAWWDLPALEVLHRDFIAAAAPLVAGGSARGPGAHVSRADADAFSRYIRGLDAWRPIPYLDPGLPADLLPADWPGARSARLFADLQEGFADASWRHVAGHAEDEE